MSNGFTPEQTEAVLIRDGGICAMWGSWPPCTQRAQTANHRMNRQAGGSKLRNGMSNACAICSTCNGDIESDGLAAGIARELGVKLRDSLEQDPDTTPLWSPFFRQMVQPHDDWLQLLGDPKPGAFDGV